jgi:ketosteroid isomerase-like protein
MRPTAYPTAQDAENAFYEALERGDIEAMMGVWAEDEEILCVHPAGPRLVGHAQVRESWQRIFSGGGGVRIHVTQRVAMQAMMVAVHNVQENAPAPAGKRQGPAVVATNVYLRTAAGWRMIVHHASHGPSQPDGGRADGAPKILH